MSNKEEKKEVTLTELATEMRGGFSRVQQGFETMIEAIDAVEKRINDKIDGIKDTMVTKTHLDIRLDKLEAATFTEDQKESILDTIKPRE